MQARKPILRLSPITLVIILGSVLKFAIHLLTGTKYGFFVDELYAIAMSKHLAFGYTDVPPLTPLLAAMSNLLFGDSLTAWHILPALAGSARLVFVCLITKEFGGKLFAVSLSALASLAMPVWLTVDSFFAYDAFDQLILVIFLYFLIKFLHSGNRRLWLVLGGIAGIACMTKMTMLFLGPGFLIALLISKYRKDLLTPWPYLGAGLALIIVSPYILWQIPNHWPTLKYWMVYGSQRLYQASIPQYAMNVFYDSGPVLFPLYAFGLYRIFRRFRETNYAFLGVLFLATLILLFFLHAKPGMIAALYAPLIAAGSVGLEEIPTGRAWGKILRPAAAAILLAGGVLTAPASIPILPIDSLLGYMKHFGFFVGQSKEVNFATSNYPIFFALRFGWEDLVKGVAKIYDQLPAEEQKNTGIYAYYYGSAAAIDYFGPQYGLPRAVSGHLAYYQWGPGYSWDTMIFITKFDTTKLSLIFRKCERKASIFNPYTIPYNNPIIYLCTEPLIPPEKIWPLMESYQ